MISGIQGLIRGHCPLDQLNEDIVMSGGFYKVVLHEMGHCLGFGTVWEDMDLVKRLVRRRADGLRLD